MDSNSQNTQKIIQERVKLLPVDITEIVTLGILEDTIKQLDQTSNLSITQLRTLETEIILVLLLFFPRKGFPERIANSLEITVDQAQDIANVVEEEIFFLIDDILTEFESNLPADTKTKSEELVPQENSLSDVPDTVDQTQALPIQKPTPTSPDIGETPSSRVTTQQTQPTAALTETTEAAKKETVVQPVRTMETDMDRIHGYGAYRKMFPDAEKSDSDEDVVRAVSQDEVLKKE